MKGKTLEWRIDADLVGTSFTGWGVSHHIGVDGTTKDMAAAIDTVPIPGALICWAPV